MRYECSLLADSDYCAGGAGDYYAWAYDDLVRRRRSGRFCSMLDVQPVLQWAAFCVVSLILLFCTRPWALRYFNSQKKVKTNVDSLIGKTAVVTSAVSNLEGQGEAVVNGLTWTARTADDSVTIPEGAHVEITAVQGVKLIVKRKEEG